MEDKVDRSGDCHIWLGAQDGRGYGSMYNHDTKRSIHPYVVVAEHAYGPCPPSMEVMHLCDNSLCVRPEHLAYGTHAENMRQARERGRTTFYDSAGRAAAARKAGVLYGLQRPENMAAAMSAVPRGSNHVRAVLTEDAVRDIRARAANGEMQKVLAAEYGVSRPAISLVVTRKRWTHV